MQSCRCLACASLRSYEPHPPILPHPPPHAATPARGGQSTRPRRLAAQQHFVTEVALQGRNCGSETALLQSLQEDDPFKDLEGKVPLIAFIRFNTRGHKIRRALIHGGLLLRTTINAMKTTTASTSKTF